MPLGLRKRFQTFGADLHALGNAIPVDGHFLDIGLPLAISSLLRMADIMSKLDALATDFTLSHVCSLVSNVKPLIYHTTTNHFGQISAAASLLFSDKMTRVCWCEPPVGGR